jgi:thiamine pyrophosphate-dependent acetolactate synthase large subunit-like protein
MVVLVGPGVIRVGAVDQLRAFVTRTGVPVAVTADALGTLPTGDEHFLGVVGLQARDVEATGLADAAVVIAIGVDVSSALPDTALPGQLLEVSPEHIEPLGFQWPEPLPPPPRSRLRAQVDELVEATAHDDAVPLAPARAVRDLSRVARRHLLVADAGPPALWLARTLPVSDPALVALPTRPAPGLAVASAMVASLDGRHALALTSVPRDETTSALLELAGAMQSRLTIVEWGVPEPWVDAGAQAVALRSALDMPGMTHVGVPVDLDATDQLTAVAGPPASASR